MASKARCNSYHHLQKSHYATHFRQFLFKSLGLGSVINWMEIRFAESCPSARRVLPVSPPDHPSRHDRTRRFASRTDIVPPASFGASRCTRDSCWFLWRLGSWTSSWFCWTVCSEIDRSHIGSQPSPASVPGSWAPEHCSQKGLSKGSAPAFAFLAPLPSESRSNETCFTDHCWSKAYCMASSSGFECCWTTSKPRHSTQLRFLFRDLHRSCNSARESFIWISGCSVSFVIPDETRQASSDRKAADSPSP